MRNNCVKRVLLIGTIVLLSGAVSASAWTGPTASPPNNNVSAPVNVGSAGQVKAGDFSTQGRLGAGTVSPSASYQLDVYKAGWKAYFHGTDGGISIGPANSGWAHIYSDNAAQPIIFNTDVYTTTNAFSSYDSDLLLKRAGTTRVTIGSGGVTIGGGSSSNWAQLNIPGTPGSVASINAAGSIYSYDKICVGNNSGYCNSTGGVVILGTGVKFPDGTTQTTAATGVSFPLVFPTTNGAIHSAGNGISLYDNELNVQSGDLYLGNRGTSNVRIVPNLYAPLMYDSNNTGYYLDPASASNLNSATFASGPYTNDWFRVNGSGGIYWQQFGGGWYMSDSTWVRAYQNKNIYTGGQVRGDGGLCIGTDCRTSWPTSGGTDTLDTVTARGATANRPIQAHRYNDDDANWYVDSNTWSRMNAIDLNQLNTSITYDRDNTGYYLDPNSTSNLYAATFASGPNTNDWFRVNGSGGIYWQAYGGGWYMQDSTWIRSYNGRYVYMDPGFDTGGASGVGCGGGLGGGYTFRVCGTLNSTSNMYANGDIYDGAIGLWVSQLRLSQQLGATYYYGATSCPAGAVMVGVAQDITYQNVYVQVTMSDGSFSGGGNINVPDYYTYGVYCRNINY